MANQLVKIIIYCFMIFARCVESKDSPDSSKLFFTYPNVTSSVCPGFYANTKLSDDPRKGEIFVAKLDGDDYPCTIIQNTVTCYIDHTMYDGEEFDDISIVSTNSSQTIAQKGEFGLHYVEVFGRFTLYSKEDEFQWYFPYDVKKCDGGVDVTGLHFLIKSPRGDENVALHCDIPQSTNFECKTDESPPPVIAKCTKRPSYIIPYTRTKLISSEADKSFIRCTIEKLTNITGYKVVSGRYTMDILFFPDQNLTEYRWSPWSNEIGTKVVASGKATSEEGETGIISNETIGLLVGGLAGFVCIMILVAVLIYKLRERRDNEVISPRQQQMQQSQQKSMVQLNTEDNVDVIPPRNIGV